MSDPDSQYAQAGVNINAGQRAVELMKDAVRATYTPQVLSDTGNFGGLFALDAVKEMAEPVLVASTDGVGTKTMVAAAMNRWDTIGQDLVNHCINDILVQGAHPLFFLDYVASSQLVPEQIAAIVTGMATACEAAGCALLGGETAEMPGVYVSGEIDVVGTVVGIVDRQRLIDGREISPGDVILGLPSTGLHTNGYSLARKVLANLDWHTEQVSPGLVLGDALLAVHRCYLPEIDLLRQSDVDIHGLAHITGGGIVDNLPRILPHNVNAIIERKSWAVPPLFQMIQQHGRISDDEMLRVFNMGIGMLVVLPAEHADIVQNILPDARIIGQVIAGDSSVIFED